jgi:hypothetical protein
MPKQGLHGFDVLSVSGQQRRERVPKDVPVEMLRDAGPLDSRNDVVLHKGIRPQGPSLCILALAKIQLLS